MYKFKNSFIALIGLLILIAGIAVINPRSGLGQKREAEVQRIALAPNPSPPTLNVNLVNTPLPVMGTINVGATPNVMLVSDVDNPARQPVQVEVNCQIQSPQNSCEEDIYTVPAGKRLVIEYASMRAEINAGQWAHFQIGAFVEGRLARHDFPLTTAVLFDGIPVAS